MFNYSHAFYTNMILYAILPYARPFVNGISRKKYVHVDEIVYLWDSYFV